jgi:hypothetical protein
LILTIPFGFCYPQSNVRRSEIRPLSTRTPGQMLSGFGVDTTSIDSVAQALELGWGPVSSYAALFLAEKGRNDYIPIIRGHFLSDSLYTGDRFDHLRALSILNAPDFTPLAYRFIDSIYAKLLRGEAEDFEVTCGLLATDLLLDHGDYSRFPFVHGVFLSSGGPELTAPQLLRFAVHGNEPVKSQAYNMIHNLVSLYPSFSFPTTLLDGLDSLRDKPQTFSILMTVASNDTDVWAWRSALSILAVRYSTNRDVYHLVTTKLNSVPPDTISPQILIDLLKLFPFPDVLQTLKDVSNLSSDPFKRDWARWAYNDYVPPLSDSSRGITELIDSLTNSLQQVSAFGWLGDNSFVGELDAHLQNAKTYLNSSDSLTCARQVRLFQQTVDDEYRDSLDGDNRFVTLEGWKFLYYNAQYILDRLPSIASLTTYSLFATHSMHLEQNSKVFSGDIGVNDAGSPPFLDSQVELSIGIGVTTAAGSSVKAHRIKVKSGATVHGSIHYNTIENNGTITGTQHTPLPLPLVATLPEFKSATPGTQNIEVPQNGTHTLQPDSYGDIMVRRNGRLILTGGTYHLSSFTGGDNVQLICQAPAEIRIAGKFDSGQGSFIGPEDTTLVSADKIMFHVGGINGTNGTLGATPKAAKIGIGNRVWASFYVPNGTLWIRQNSEATGQFIGKDVDVGIGVKVRKIMTMKNDE